MKEALKKIILYPTYKEKQKRSIQRLKKDYEYYQKYTKEEINFYLLKLKQN